MQPIAFVDNAATTPLVTPVTDTNPLPVIEQGGKYLDENGNLLTVQRAFANITASSTDSVIVALSAGYKIRVLSYIVHAGGTATVMTFYSDPTPGSSTAISHDIACGANGGEVGPFNKDGWFETLSGEGLSGTTGSGSTVGVTVVYAKVPV